MAQPNSKITTVISDVDPAQFEEPIFRFASVHFGSKQIDPIRIASINQLIAFEDGLTCETYADLLVLRQQSFQLSELAREGALRSWYLGSRACVIITGIATGLGTHQFYEEVDRLLRLYRKVAEWELFPQIKTACMTSDARILLIEREPTPGA